MRIAVLLAIILLATPSSAQDIVGVEDCAKARDPDKKVGCLQSNVNYLHGLIRRNETASQARLRDINAKLAAATAQVEGLLREVTALKAALDELKKKDEKKDEKKKEP